MADWMDRISDVRVRARALEERLADPAVARQPAELAKAGKELSELRPLLEAGRRYEETLRSVAEARALAADADPELAELAKSELPELEARRDALEARDPRAAAPEATRTTTRTRSSRSAPAPAATRPRCSRPICSACTRATPSAAAGRSSRSR